MTLFPHQLFISPGQPQGNPQGCTPLLPNGSGHDHLSELGSAAHAGNGALGGPKAHRKLQTHPSLGSQAGRKSKSSTRSASQVPLQAQEGKAPAVASTGSITGLLLKKCTTQPNST